MPTKHAKRISRKPPPMPESLQDRLAHVPPAYRIWLESAGATMTGQKELMRHASIQTTLGIYGRAQSAAKRQVNAKVVEQLLKTIASAALIIKCSFLESEFHNPCKPLN
jgi:hypothetical protein